jgi:hypothetical protein
MKVKGYFGKNLRDNNEERYDFRDGHFAVRGLEFDSEGMPYEEAKLTIEGWNKIDRDEKHNFEYRLDIPEERKPETPEIIEKPMKFKEYYRYKMKGYGSRSSAPYTSNFTQYDFDQMEIPYDDEGMDAEHALYYINRKNKESQESKFWLKIEE